MTTLASTLVNTTLRGLTGVICEVDDAEMARIPRKGPLIMVGNHINFLDSPILFSRMHPRPLSVLVKVETWQSPLTAFLFHQWRGIPIRRGEADREAFRQAREVLERGEFLAIAPEGTRSGHGRLQKGLPGVVLLAVRTSVPLMPVSCYGIERFHPNIRRLVRTRCNIRVGNPFRIDTAGEKLSTELSELIVVEIMYQLASLLPPENRGVYSDMSKASENYLRFEPGVMSNLKVVRKYW